jgi:hypothetical protein
MTSAINPNNINGAYPVAGQDNNSQGFRDNFTNTKTNFEYAASEISDLQNKAVLKSSLTGTTLNNNMGGSLLSNAQLQDMSATVVALGSVTGSQVIDYAAGPYYTLATTGSVTLSFNNFPTAGTLGCCRVRITVASTAHTVTLPAAVTIGTTNLQGYASNIITFNQTGTYEFEFETVDAGATISVFDLNRNRDPIYLPSSEDLAASAEASIVKTTSYFTTATTETATLAAGYAGQVKVLAMYGDGGDMVITVTNPGWGGAGTITFTAVGQACTLMYINAKWFCIGNNAATFA